jgi:hypothetical protein
MMIIMRAIVKMMMKILILVEMIINHLLISKRWDMKKEFISCKVIRRKLCLMKVLLILIKKLE